MKRLILPALAVLLFAACHDKNRTPQPSPLTGGTGGSYSIAAFTTVADTSVNARVFIKYAANSAPADTNSYNDKKTAQAEPPEGAHAHFNNLTTGTYFIRAIYAGKSADATVNITSTSETETDITLKLQ